MCLVEVYCQNRQLGLYFSIDFLIVLLALYVKLVYSVISLMSMPTALRTGTTMYIACTNLVFVQSRLE